MNSLQEKPGCLLGLLNTVKSLLESLSESSAQPSKDFPYTKRQYLFTRAERSFFGVLQQALNDEFLIFAKVRLADLILVRKGTDNYMRYFGRIQAKHVDFVLCSRDGIQPLLAIELDDASHRQKSRQERDAFMDRALNAAGLPILRVKARQEYNPRELRSQIMSLLSPDQQQPRPAPRR